MKLVECITHFESVFTKFAGFNCCAYKWLRCPDLKIIFCDFCVHHDNNDNTTDYFIPCTCMQGNNASSVSDYQSYFLQGKAIKGG